MHERVPRSSARLDPDWQRAALGQAPSLASAADRHSRRRISFMKIGTTVSAFIPLMRRQAAQPGPSRSTEAWRTPPCSSGRPAAEAPGAAKVVGRNGCASGKSAEGRPAERAPRADPHRRARFRGSSLARGALPLTELRTSPPARSPARTGGYSPRVLRSRQMISLNLAAASGSAHRGAALTAAVGSRRESLPGGASSGVLERLYGKGAPSGARLCDHHCPVIGCGMPYACKPGECSIKISSGPRHLQSRESRCMPWLGLFLCTERCRQDASATGR